MNNISNIKMKDTIFLTYKRLYPGKEGEILKAMDEGASRAKEDGLEGKDYYDMIEAYILDAMD